MVTAKFKRHNDLRALSGRDSRRTSDYAKLWIYKEIWLGVRDDFRNWLIREAA